MSLTETCFYSWLYGIFRNYRTFNTDALEKKISSLKEHQNWKTKNRKNFSSAYLSKHFRSQYHNSRNLTFNFLEDERHYQKWDEISHFIWHFCSLYYQETWPLNYFRYLSGSEGGLGRREETTASSYRKRASISHGWKGQNGHRQEVGGLRSTEYIYQRSSKPNYQNWLEVLGHL